MWKYRPSESSGILEVWPGVYPPSEDTYALLELALKFPRRRFLEVGTGCGYIGIHYALETGAKGLLTDVSKKAVECARHNVKKLGLPLEVKEADLLKGINSAFPLAIFNPPYLPGKREKDPRIFGGPRGGETLEEFLRQARARIPLVVTLVSEETEVEVKGWHAEIIPKEVGEDLRLLVLRSELRQKQRPRPPPLPGAELEDQK